MHKFGLPVVVAINRFHTDTEAEILIIKDFCEKMGVEVSLAEVFEKVVLVELILHKGM